MSNRCSYTRSIASAGLAHPDDVTRDVVSTRVERNKTQTYAETYPELKPGALLEGSSVPNEYFRYWKRATPDNF